jgi:hypothetical protein
MKIRHFQSFFIDFGYRGLPKRIRVPGHQSYQISYLKVIGRMLRRNMDHIQLLVKILENFGGFYIYN